MGAPLIRYGVKGGSDILGICPGSGKLLALECKTDKGKLSDDQEKFLHAVADAGGVAIVARSVDSLEKHRKAILG